MEEFTSAIAMNRRSIRTSKYDRRIAMSTHKRMLLENAQREHRELFSWLAEYSHAVAQGVRRNHLLTIFDATFESVREHFRSVEVLLEHISGARLQRHCLVHSQITEQLASYRTRLAGSEPLDRVECAHALDCLLVHFIKEQPVFNKLYARLNHAPAR